MTGQTRGRHPNDSTIAAVHVNDDVFMPCPETLLPLVGWCVELDAKAIVRALWPHLLEASFAGLEPFTLKASSS